MERRFSGRRAVAVTAGKAVSVASRRLGRGGGTTAPGIVAERLRSSVARELAAQLSSGCLLVSGTNGKTTSARILASILTAEGHTVIRNETGANLPRGVAASLVESATVRGNLPAGRRSVGLFEVDEAALPTLLETLRPRGVLLLNLFRDQLDRYGEVATVARLWRQALQRFPPENPVLINGDDPLLVDTLEGDLRPPVCFGIDSADRSRAGPEHAGDVKACPRCGDSIRYDAVFLAHLGHYRCASCGFGRPDCQVRALDVQLLGLAGSSFVLVTPDGEAHVALPLPGMYNVYNALAAAAAAWQSGVRIARIASAVSAASPAFGRMERIQIDDRPVVLALTKNPAGLNEVVRTALQGNSGLHLLVILNDNAADGFDVSWIWDADIEMLAGAVRTVVFSGTRAADIALRFKYAGALPADGRTSWRVEEDIGEALASAVSLTPNGENLIVMPTYTALLEVRRTMAALGYVKPFWES
ncbi:MAG TPA: MurT ligase domain-containing protein [Chloroflexota bacterium]|nr:MurT ligase domain-containing protein [Chloroflexota bacterium]